MLVTSIFLFCLGIGQVPPSFAQLRVVDLDAPGVLDTLARDNPRHYTKVREIISEVRKQPEGEVTTWMRTRFDARDVVYGPLLLVTHPPKRRLSFTIDDVRYRSIVTLSDWQPKPIPAK